MNAFLAKYQDIGVPGGIEVVTAGDHVDLSLIDRERLLVDRQRIRRKVRSDHSEVVRCDTVVTEVACDGASRTALGRWADCELGQPNVHGGRRVPVRHRRRIRVAIVIVTAGRDDHPK